MTRGRFAPLVAVAVALSGCAGTGSAPDAPAAAPRAAITGTAAYRERMALPPEAVFEATLSDVSRADAAAEVLGRQRIEPAGQPPFAIDIEYDPARIRTGGRYAVRATVRVGDQLWFTTDTHHGVLERADDRRVDVMMIRVPQQAVATGAPLLGTRWRLVEVSGRPVPPATTPAREAHLVLEAEGQRAVGSGGCNRFTGGYTLEGDRLAFSPMAATRMACVDGEPVEGPFLQALERVDRHRVEGDRLVLTGGDAGPDQVVLRFEAARGE